MNTNNKDNSTPHRASEYEKNVRQTIPYYEVFHEETIDFVKAAKPGVKTWLDTGCGTGSLVARAAELFPDTCFLLADPSEGMREQVEQNLSHLPENRVLFLGCIDTVAVSLGKTEKPEIITAIQCHHYLDKEGRKLAVQNCYNLLSDDGIFITFENIRPYTSIGLEIGLKRWMDFQRSRGKAEDAVLKHGKRFGKAYFPITPAEHIHLLKECGFRVVEQLWLSRMQAGFYGIK